MRGPPPGVLRVAHACQRSPRALGQAGVPHSPLQIGGLGCAAGHAVRHLAPPSQQDLRETAAEGVLGPDAAGREPAGRGTARQRAVAGPGCATFVAVAPGSMQCATAGWRALRRRAASLKVHMATASLLRE
jgi:hypothetical protein